MTSSKEISKVLAKRRFATVSEIITDTGGSRLSTQLLLNQMKRRGEVGFRADAGGWFITEEKKPTVVIIRDYSRLKVLLASAKHDIDNDEDEYPEAVVELVYYIATGVAKEDEGLLRDLFGLGHVDERIKMFVWLAVELGKKGWFKTTKEVKGKRKKRPRKRKDGSLQN